MQPGPRTGREFGLSLVEILVALAIGMALTAGIMQIYVGNKQTFRATDALARLQENGRFAIETMTRDARMAGFTGCPPSNVLTNVLSGSTTVWWEKFGSGTIVGYDGSAVFPGRATGTASGDRVSGTDAFVALQGGTDEYLVLTHNLGANQILLNRSPRLQAGAIIIVCDAKQTSIAQVTNVSGAVLTLGTSGFTPGNSSALGYGYASGALVVEYQPTAYYIGVGTSGSGRALYRYRLQQSGTTASAVADELIDQVQDMQVHYGVDADSDNLVDLDYRDAGTVADWTRVVSMRLSLLFRSAEQNVTTTTQRVVFPASDTGLANSAGSTLTLAAGDRSRYLPFVSTVTIRNRLP